MLKPNPKVLTQVGLILATGLLAIGCGGSSSSSAAVSANDAKLVFDSTAYDTLNVYLDGSSTATPVRQYKVAYCANPIEMNATQTEYGPDGSASSKTLDDVYGYQKMYIYVPETQASNQTTAILLRVSNAGWKPSMVGAGLTDEGAYSSTSDSDAMGAALKAGYIVVSAGTRGRGLVDASGNYVGHSPACMVDTKAIVRYLRLNDGKMPGSAERIFLCGTSGGGGLTVAAAASGNSSDYYSYLAEIGAAGIVGSGSSATSTIKDDVFGAVAYCPINNLSNHDGGYEWQYNAIRTAANTSSISIGGTSVAYADTTNGDLQAAASAVIKDYFPTYLNGLGLTWETGNLVADNMQDAIKKHLKEEVERQLEAGKSVPALDEDFTITLMGPPGAPPSTKTIKNEWLTWSGAQVTNIDFTKFAAFQASLSSLKSVPAFDQCGVTGNTLISGESSLYGEAAHNYSNFTEWAWNNNAISGDASGIDDTTYSFSTYLARSDNSLAKQIKMANPIPYLKANSGSTVAPNWYIRHGMIDRDGATAMQVLLYYAVKNNSSVEDVNFKLPYLTGHGGDYDVQEAFTWIAEKVAASK